jgi:hypothetical protein
MKGSLLLKALIAIILFILISVVASCSHSQPISVLNAPPSTAYRTLGMVSGQGENESSAMLMALDQAARVEADAVIVESNRPLGRQIVVTARAIKYLILPPAE